MKDILYLLTHPKEAINTKGRQIAVATEHSTPPVGSTIEEFPNLSIKEASKLLRQASKGGIQLEDWPTNTQEIMKRGQKITPNGSHPEHQNI